MPLLGKLIANAFLPVVIGSAIAAYAAVSIFPLTPEQARTFWTAVLVGVPLEGLAVALGVGLAARPIRRAFSGPADAAALERAAAAARWIPTVAACAVLLAGTAGTAWVVAAAAAPASRAISPGRAAASAWRARSSRP